MGLRPAYQTLAKELGEALFQSQMDLVYGGGRVGLMGIVSRTVMQLGGQVLGVIPKGLFGKEQADDEITELKVVNSMHERKAFMEKSSDAFIILPGGFGTMDEFFEILTWAQIGIHNKPIAILNFENFYDSLLQQMDLMIREGFVDPKNKELIIVADSVGELMQELKVRLQ